MGTAHSAQVLHEDAPHENTGDEYYYGHRTIIEYDENGNSSFRERPLTLEDFLDPEEGDVYMQGTLHEDDVDRLKSIFRFHLKDRKDITVYSDLKIEWGVDGLPNPAPDISVIEDVKEPKKPRGTFSVPEEGVKPFFVLEVVSPRYRDADTDKKPEIYRKAGVSEYIIADPGLKGNEISYTVYGYRLIGNRYVRIASDRQGRIYSQTTDVWVGVSESGDRLIITDGRTGEEIMSDDERAEDAENKAVKAENKAVKAENKAVKAENKAVKAESKAVKAESKAVKAESKAVKAENKAVKAENKAVKAENKAEQEKNRAEQEKARADSAEEELRRLNAELKALKSNYPPS